MAPLNDFINKLIPDRFKLTYELKTKSRGIVITQIFIGSLLVFVGIMFWILEQDLKELILNSGIGLFLLASLFTLKYFYKFESYVNLNLIAGYVVVVIFNITGGLYSDAPFWFAILISITTLYTSKKHLLFWSLSVTVFLISLYYVEINGYDFHYEQVTYTKKATTLFSYLALLIISTYSYTRISIRKTSFHLEYIEQQKQLLKERDDLMSVIAHDMKSPSRRIEGLLSIFDKSNLTNDQKDTLARLNNTAVENQQLIDDLIEATRFQSNLELKSVSVNNAINDLQEGYLPLSSKKNIRLIIYGLNKKINIESSPHHLKRILDNLFSNAIKFSPLESRVEITCVQNKLNTSISIKDQGPGFTKEDEKGMFKMFQKLSAQPTAGETSSGLGLSIVKNLTELLKGEIKYVTQVGAGSTFTLVLPNKFPNDNKNGS